MSITFLIYGYEYTARHYAFLGYTVIKLVFLFLLIYLKFLIFNPEKSMIFTNFTQNMKNAYNKQSLEAITIWKQSGIF